MTKKIWRWWQTIADKLKKEKCRCPKCNGKGYVTELGGYVFYAGAPTCPECKGSGKISN